MSDRRQKIRKAAVLLASLDPATAERLLAQLDPEQAETARRALAELDSVDPIEQQQVADEFARIGPLVPLRDPAGIELDSRLARQLAGGGEIERYAVAGPSSGPPDPAAAHSGRRLDDAAHEESSHRPHFRFLEEADVAALAPYLERERPQTIAVVVSHLLPVRAAELLAALPEATQAEVAGRLVELDQADPEVIRELERGLETWLAEHVQTKRRRSAGLAALEGIVAAADDRARNRILGNLQRHDYQLAKRLGAGPQQPPADRSRRRAAPPAPQPTAREPVRWRFADVERLDGTDWLALLHRADTEVVVLALAGAAAQLVERVLAQLPAHEANALRYAVDHLGPTRLSDVERAQQALADTAARLDAAEQLSSAHRRLSLAV